MITKEPKDPVVDPTVLNNGAQEAGSEKKSPWYKNKLVWQIGGIALAVGFGLGAFALKNNTADRSPGVEVDGAANNYDDQPDNTLAETETTTTEAETELSYEEQVAALEIPAGLSPEELADAFADRLNQWLSAGCDDLLAGRSNYNINNIDSLATKNAQVFKDALFMDWKEYEKKVGENWSLIEYMSNWNYTHLVENLKGNESKSWYTVDDGFGLYNHVLAKSPPGAEESFRQIEIPVTRHGNSDDSEALTYYVIFYEVNGTEKVSYVYTGR